MCHPSWGPALIAARHLDDLARLRRVRDRIDREYAHPLDVVALARDAHMPAGHLSRRFRQAYGKSPYAYVVARRAERATALPWRGGPGVTEARPVRNREAPAPQPHLA
ncbi:AraC family transcriptional regulator [Streptomyces sp. NPDC006172]|uniref:AraC family transcriptional regulator n=1 Tax=Streptomyces sp. NPDC006172 TaxID=3154470 RepID=UPI0033CA74F8